MPSFLGGKLRGALRQPAFFLAGNRMTTFTFEKELSLVGNDSVRQKWSLELEKKVSNIYELKEKVQKNTQLSFGGTRNVQVTKIAFEDFIFVVDSAAKSVGATLEFAAFRSGPNAKYSRASASCFFFCPQPWFLICGGPNQFPRKNTSKFMSIGILSREKKRVVKLTSISSCSVLVA